MSWETIAYQTRKFDRAEECFRQALDLNPAAFEPLVNLGGVLVTMHKLDEAADYNLRAVLARPNDALANSQLGQTYFGWLAWTSPKSTSSAHARSMPRTSPSPASVGRDPPAPRRAPRSRRRARRIPEIPPRLAPGRQNETNHRRIAAIMELFASPHRPAHSRDPQPPARR